MCQRGKAASTGDAANVLVVFEANEFFVEQFGGTFEVNGVEVLGEGFPKVLTVFLIFCCGFDAICFHTMFFLETESPLISQGAIRF